MEQLDPRLRQWLDDYLEAISLTEHDAAICVMTDLHTERLRPYRVMNYLARSGQVDVCLSLGDVVDSRYQQKRQAIAMLELAFRVLKKGDPPAVVIPVRGNHDVNPVKDFDTRKMVSNREYWELAGNHGIFPHAGVNYGYLDLEKAKLRLIFLDTSDIFDDTGKRLSTNNEVMIRQEQFDWFCHGALNLRAKENAGDWAVMVFGHSSMEKLCPAAFTAALDGFTEGRAARGSFPYNSAGYAYTLELDADFTEQGPGQFLCSVSGHEHRDSVNRLGRHREVYTICYGEGCYYLDSDGRWHWYNRRVDTAEEHAVDTILVNRQKKQVLFKRFGLGRDRVLEME